MTAAFPLKRNVDRGPLPGLDIAIADRLPTVYEVPLARESSVFARLCSATAIELSDHVAASASQRGSHRQCSMSCGTDTQECIRLS